MSMKIIDDRRDCSGCHACVNACPHNCIEMVADQEGFWYPHVDGENCVECGACVRACPAQSARKIPAGIRESEAYAAINRNDAERRGSSSGGVFSLLAKETIASGGVVFGAAFDESFGEVCHIAVECPKELYRLRGSKYLQSRIGTCFQEAEELLREGRRVLFSGTPCQIQGLKSYLGMEYENLLCVDLVCHGVPSPKVWEAYRSFQEANANSKVYGAEFRCKDAGWRQNSIQLTFRNGSTYQKSASEDPYMQAFLQDACLRPSCMQCHFKTIVRTADLTLADFWGIERVAPEMDDNAGTSLVITHTDRGRSALEKISEEMRLQKVGLADAVAGNVSMVRSVQAHPKRAEFFAHLDVLPFDVLVAHYAKPKKNYRALLARGLKKAKAYIFADR